MRRPPAASALPPIRDQGPSVDRPRSVLGVVRSIGIDLSHRFDRSADDDGERVVPTDTASIATFEGQIGRQVADFAAKAGIADMKLVLARDQGSLGICSETIAPTAPGREVGRRRSANVLRPGGLSARWSARCRAGTVDLTMAGHLLADVVDVEVIDQIVGGRGRETGEAEREGDLRKPFQPDIRPRTGQADVEPVVDTHRQVRRRLCT